MHHRKNCDAISHLAFRLENFRFSCKAQYAIRVSPDVHSNARRFFFVALRSQGRNPKESVLLPFSFPDRHSAKRDGGLLLPYPRGDRPPGNVPDGMSKIKFRSFPQNTANYTKTAAPESIARRDKTETPCPSREKPGADLPRDIIRQTGTTARPARRECRRQGRHPYPR